MAHKTKIYLAGYISDEVLDKCLEWRNWFKEQCPGYVFIDPMEGENLDSLKNKGLESDIPANAIVHRDLASVKTAGIVMVNTDTFGKERPIIGSVFEMAWAAILDKPVIVLSNDENYSKHPFVQGIASVITGDRKEALRILHYIMKGH